MIIHRTAVVLLLAAALAACRTKDAGNAADQAQADTVPRQLTRQEALAEYRKCIRTMTTVESSAQDGSRTHINTNPSDVCRHLLSQAYREPEHVRRRDPSNVGRATPTVSP